MIRGRVVRRPRKEDLSVEIAAALNLTPPAVSTGSSVESAFLEQIHQAITGRPSGGSDAYRKTERLLLQLGRTYDPFWDTSESRGPTGGSTVTVRAYSQILSAITGRDRCLLMPFAGRVRPRRVPVDPRRIPGAKVLAEAGPGSKVIFFNNDRPSPAIVGIGTIRYVWPGWQPPWEVDLAEYIALRNPIPAAEIDIRGWWPDRSLREVTFEVYNQIYETTGLESTRPLPPISGPSPDEAPDPGGDIVAERILARFPVREATPSISVPESLPQGVLCATEARAPSYTETPDGVTQTGPTMLPSRSSNRQRDKLAELRAVELVSKALVEDGWRLTHDRQKNGVGYDLEFKSGSRTLHVEVKGVQSPRLAFNMTPKEFWRAETDPDFVVIAVTSVLSPVDYHLHLIPRDRIVAATRVVTGFRLSW